jgi:hypothetical protein
LCVQIHKQCALALLRRNGGQVAGDGGLADPTLLVENDASHGSPEVL